MNRLVEMLQSRKPTRIMFQQRDIEPVAFQGFLGKASMSSPLNGSIEIEVTLEGSHVLRVLEDL